jgi:hypothetical protein
MFAVALMTAAIGVLGLAQSAVAGTSYSFAFRSTDVDGNAIAGGTASGSTFEFASPSAAAACNPGTGAGCPVIDVLVTTTDPLIAVSISVGYASGPGGIDIASATEWAGVGTVFNMAMTATAFFAPINTNNTIDNTAGTFGSFDGVQPPPNGPPSLAAGTYSIGTIVWDTSGSGPGFWAINNFNGVLDATGAVIGGMITNVTAFVGLGTGGINVVPEPGTAGLLALGLAGLVLAGRRRS